MDFCHCKGDWNGTIGAISVKSSNNNVIQLATCISPKETAAAYEYLIDQACKNKEVKAFLDKPTTSIITDKHKGSESAVPRLLSQSEHLRCGEHMLKNAGPVGPVRSIDGMVRLLAVDANHTIKPRPREVIDRTFVLCAVWIHPERVF